MKKYVKKIGFWGGCSIFHPYRSDKETKPIVLDEGVAFKSVNNFNPRELQQYMKQIIGIDVNCWYISPHFHLIGYGNIDGLKVADLYSKTGWIFKNVGVRRSVLGTAFYQLTHAGVVKGTNIVNWIGGMANSQDSWINRYGYDPLDVKKRISRCPYCDTALKKLVWMAEEDPPLMNEPEGGYLIDFITGFAEVFELNSDRVVTETSRIDDYEYAQNPSEYLVLR